MTKPKPKQPTPELFTRIETRDPATGQLVVTMVPKKRGPGRPRAPGGPLTATQRDAARVERLQRSGGRRIPFNATGEDAEHIARIKERDGTITDTDTIRAALAWYASRRIAPHKG